MGGCISFQVSCDQVLNRVGSCFCGKGNHIGNLEKNLVDLEKSMGVLKARRDDSRYGLLVFRPSKTILMI
ncbi:BnaA09g47310D [Brassica napus]|uniref:BnaA09g47310D protein n=1 Tax=Brassica napus TaxID=3708 RepID=A0A078GMM7_BRANA|nr:BnaA09g47310D [Brassica napus]